MKGNYNNEIPEKRFIYEEESHNSKNGFFRKELFFQTQEKLIDYL